MYLLTEAVSSKRKNNLPIPEVFTLEAAISDKKGPTFLAGHLLTFSLNSLLTALLTVAS